jgi:acetoin utilization deacetylase AcuC-like enzyme
LKIYYHDHFVLPLPEGHRFPMAKYALLRERLVADGVVPAADLLAAPEATDAELGRAHDGDYVRRVRAGEMSPAEMRRIGFPWSAELVTRSLRSVGSTLAAARAAAADGLALTLAGGTHHAGRAHGEGFCVFNDCAVAARALQAEELARRVVILDCDVHQGNGTAAIFAADATVFTYSLHGAHNYPFRKVAGDLDVALPDDADDAVYLDALEATLPQALEQAQADFAFYLAGADPYAGDRLGRLAVTKRGLAERDRFVLRACRAAGLPLAITMAGGYAKRVEDTVDIHLQTVRIAAGMAAR